MTELPVEWVIQTICATAVTVLWVTAMVIRATGRKHPRPLVGMLFGFVLVGWAASWWPW